MRRAFSFTALALVSACATAPKPQPAAVTDTVPPPAPVTALSVPPPAPVAQLPVTEAPPVQESNHSVAYSVPRPQEWADRPIADAIRMRSWTPDAVIGNGTTGALLAFSSVPAALGTTAQVAEGIRANMRSAKTLVDVVMEEVGGTRASFAFASDDGSRRGKVVVTRAPGLATQYVLIVGEWPADADTTSVTDVNVIAKSIQVSPAP